jgi:hypothetical protein
LRRASRYDHVYDAAQLNSTRCWVELSCVALTKA